MSFNDKKLLFYILYVFKLILFTLLNIESILLFHCMFTNDDWFLNWFWHVKQCYHFLKINKGLLLFNILLNKFLIEIAILIFVTGILWVHTCYRQSFQFVLDNKNHSNNFFEWVPTYFKKCFEKPKNFEFLKLWNKQRILLCIFLKKMR